MYVQAEAITPNVVNRGQKETPITTFSTASNASQAWSEVLPRGRTAHSLAHQFSTPASSPRTGTQAETSRLIQRPPQIRSTLGESRDPQTVRSLTQPGLTNPDSTSRQPAINGEIFVVQSAAPELQGVLSKDRLYGPSHYLSSFEQFDEIRAFASNHDHQNTTSSQLGGTVSEIHALLQRCEDLARRTKAQHSLPSRDIADRLIGPYLRNFESTYRVLHIPSFLLDYEQYWVDPRKAADGFVVTVFLVMAIGTCFYVDPASEDQIRSTAIKWIHAAQSWLSAPIQKGRLSIDGLQVHCLLLLARQTNFVGPDLVWISIGTLLRIAIHMGLHRDPTKYPAMSPFLTEVRRRLWATVLELAVQTSLDGGMPPLISFEDFDTLAPSNIADEDISETTEALPTSKPETSFTCTSLQIGLLKSLRGRLEVARLINHFRSNPTYEDVLRLSSEIFDAIRESGLRIRTHLSSAQGKKPTVFQCNLIEHLLRRFLLALHRPFAIKARKDPGFYFSRKVCLDQALTISSPQADDDFSRLIAIGGGIFQEVMTHGALALCLELTTQLQEDDRNMNLQGNRVQRELIHEAIKRVITLSKERLRLGDTNVKGLLFLSMAMGQIESIEAGTSPEEGILSAAKQSAIEGYEDPNLDLLAGSADFDTNFGDAASWLFPAFEEIPWTSSQWNSSQ